jgi:hypothetical protein
MRARRIGSILPQDNVLWDSGGRISESENGGLNQGLSEYPTGYRLRVKSKE